MFSQLQLILLPCIVAIVVLVTCYLLYKFGKKPLKNKNLTFTDRMEALYTITAAALLGKFLFFSLPDATGPGGPQSQIYVTGFVYLGFFVMICLQKYDRVSFENPNYVAPASNGVDIRAIINSETMTIQEYTAMDNSEESPQRTWTVLDEFAELKKRRLLCFISICVIFFTCVLEGFFLIFKEPFSIGGSWVIFAFFIIDKIMETVIINVVMLHALVHAEDYKWFLIVTILWFFVCVGSLLPVILQMSWQECYIVVTHLATSIFYGIAGGFQFYIALYYIWIDRKRTDKRDTILRLTLFGLVGALSFVCGVFV